MTCRVAPSVGLRLLCATHRQVSLIICVTRLASWFARQRVTDVRQGCKTQRTVPTLRQVADLMCARTKEREYFKTCIVGHVNCCLQGGPKLTATTVLQISFHCGSALKATSVRLVGYDKLRRLQCGPTLTATSVLQVIYRKSCRFQYGLSVTLAVPVSIMC
ncbi:hypothetical protein PoB_000463700 [Plakobranchus ocellatus]|uniref:Secreted protein n=1 Tax=Plakobranchus ocellatus TaxID=259542 RepID=A0AAV3Y6N9_9GAST|nr:hypothetical protein PoB_000463700 [Plakobranchus ocellatus]